MERDDMFGAPEAVKRCEECNTRMEPVWATSNKSGGEYHIGWRCPECGHEANTVRLHGEKTE
jgi:uncharacterized protein with PIN domain